MEDAAQQYFEQIIKPSLIPEIQDEIKQRQKEGYRIVIVSGGYSIYIKHFMEYIGGSADDVLATPLLFTNGKFTGKMGLDCMAENKISYIKKRFKQENIYSVAYSDSPTDLPLFDYSNEVYYVIPVSKSKQTKNIFTLIYRE